MGARECRYCGQRIYFRVIDGTTMPLNAGSGSRHDCSETRASVSVKSVDLPATLQVAIPAAASENSRPRGGISQSFQPNYDHIARSDRKFMLGCLGTLVLVLLFVVWCFWG